MLAERGQHKRCPNEVDVCRQHGNKSKENLRYIAGMRSDVLEAPTAGDPREDRGDAGWTRAKQFHLNQNLYGRDIKQRLTNAWENVYDRGGQNNGMNDRMYHIIKVFTATTAIRTHFQKIPQ